MPRGKPQRKLVIRAWKLLGIVAIPLLVVGLWNLRSVGQRGTDKAPRDPRLTTSSPFRNTRPDVQYVGDDVCRRCHSEIAQSYQRHPMGQSLMPLPAATRVEQFEGSSSEFEAQGFRYRVDRRGPRVVHAETKLGHDGEVVSQVEAEIEFVLGSGRLGRSYLFQRDGRLFQSPISWYTQEQHWDLAAGYQGANLHFERPISASCLFCHSNMVQEVAGKTNCFEPPIFRGFAVGCERCHGPGELHARQPRAGDGIDYTIVNPRHLNPELREAVCQQCHLQADGRVLRANLDTFDYRPGLPLHQFWSIFLLDADSTGVPKAVGQVEQLHSSRCFRESGGKLGCISCHDPHRTPTMEERTDFYRERCQTCHDSNDCTMAAAERRQQSPDDNCIQCHMPRRETDIVHTALSDHRIVRRPDQANESPVVPRRDQRDSSPLLHFHADLADPHDPGILRDRGIGLTLLAQSPEGRPVRTRLGQLAVPLLRPAVAAWPADAAAWEALGYAYWLQGQVQEAEESYRAALRLAPEREKVLVDLAQLNAGIGRRHAAIDYCQRAIAVNPYASSYHAGLAELFASGSEWEKTVAACQSALKLNPADRETRKLLVSSYLRMGNRSRALAEFEIFVQLDPPERESALRKWLAEQL